MANGFVWAPWKSIGLTKIKCLKCCDCELTDTYIEVYFDTLIYSYRISFHGEKINHIKNLYCTFHHLHFKQMYNFTELDSLLYDLDVFLSRVDRLMAFS